MSVSERARLLPFHQPWMDEASIKAVVEVLESGWLTRGPKTAAFEEAFAGYVGARHAIGLNSCTAGRWWPWASGRVTKSSPRLALARRHRLHVIEDAAHAIEAACPAGKVGAIGDVTAFSFYATKNLTTGEGGMLTTNDDGLAERMRILGLHGISRDAWQRHAPGAPAHWETVAPGYKYNMFDIQAALGLSQLERLEEWWHVRAAHVRRYRAGLADLPAVRALGEEPGVRHAHHLFVVILDTDRLSGGRDAVMADLRGEGIGIGIHFRSLSLQPLYRERCGPWPDLPVAEAASDRLLSLPLYPKMTAADVDRVLAALRR